MTQFGVAQGPDAPRPAYVTDPADPRLAPFALRDRALRRPGRANGYEAAATTFVGESPVVVERMLAAPGVTIAVLARPAHEAWVLARADASVTVLVAPAAVLDATAGYPVHRGVLALGRRPPPESQRLDAVVPRGSRPLTLLGCEDITDPENVGLLFRTAAAFGCAAVVLSPACHDPLYRRAVRVSAGHVVTMPWARADDWPGDLDRLRNEWGVTVLAASTQGEPLARVRAEPERVAVLVGTEGAGLAPATLALCDMQVRIPMRAGVDSLNVGVAAGVLLERFSRAERV